MKFCASFSNTFKSQGRSYPIVSKICHIQVSTAWKTPCGHMYEILAFSITST